MKINLQKFKDLLISKGEKGEELANEIIIEHDFRQFKLSTEETIEIDGEKIGKDMTVMLVADEGKSPLPEGTYQTEEGYRFSVDDKGVVTKVDEEMISEEKFSELETKINKLTESVSVLAKAVKQNNEFAAQSFKELAKAIEPSPDGDNDGPPAEPLKFGSKNPMVDQIINQFKK